MWRYRELLPVMHMEDVVSLGEGMTPLLRAPAAGKRKGLKSLYIKDESRNPTQTFKARGMSVAVSMAKQLGLTKLTLATAGNAGEALAAYAARAEIKAHIFMPRDSSPPNVLGSQLLGAKVTLVDGLIHDCAAQARSLAQGPEWFDVSTLNEPYRIEGKKSMGFELAEQLDWCLPDSIIYPTGGGSGLIGMWKAFQELQAIGWITPKLPKMFSVQAVGCSPIVQAFGSEGARSAASQLARANRPSGLRVPMPSGSAMIVEILKKSGGGAVEVTEEQILGAISEMGAAEGIFPAPEGAAGYAAIEILLRSRAIAADEKVILFNTGAGVKYLDWFEPNGSEANCRL